MDNKPKIVDGEIAGESGSTTGRLIRRPVVELQNIPAPADKKKLTPEQQATADRLLKEVDMSAVEQRLMNTYAGGFIGLCYDDDTDDATEEPTPLPAERRIILTDKDHD